MPGNIRSILHAAAFLEDMSLLAAPSMPVGRENLRDDVAYPPCLDFTAHRAIAEDGSVLFENFVDTFVDTSARSEIRVRFNCTKRP